MKRLTYVGQFSRVSVGDTGEVLAKNKRLGGEPIQVNDELAAKLLETGEWELADIQDVLIEEARDTPEEE
jgi:hypothetical protein